MEFEPLRPTPTAEPVCAAGLWECKLCNRSMPETSKKAHLKGKPHAKKVAAAGGQTPDKAPSRAPEPVVNTTPEKKKDKWRCPTCKCTMKSKYKKCHLGSNSHNEKLIATGGTPEFWNCNICNYTVKMQKQAYHLAGKFHARRLKTQPQPKSKSKSTQVTAQPVMVNTEPQQRARAGKPDKGPPHPNGKHFIKISEVKDVYDDIDEIPIGIWQSAQVLVSHGMRTLVTAMEVQAARDVFDALEVTGDEGDEDGNYNGGDEQYGDEYGFENDDGQWDSTVEANTSNWDTPVGINAGWD